MAKNIQLNLTINGVKQNISNIKELETAIKAAEEELKGLEIGSEQFTKLSTQVKQAKGVFEDFQESIKGQELEKRVGAFAKVGEGITASFAGAQAAISLFGTESEAVAEAAAKAQSLLTIALAARSAAEGVVAVRTVAANIATYASAAAAGAATTATRVLYATLAANPYGAILAVIGLVVGALYALSSASKTQVNVQKELSQATSEEANSLKNSLFILTQMNGARNLQRQELEKLKKEYPGFNAFIDKENRLTEAGVRFIKLKIKQYELEAQAKLIVQKIAENGIKILEIEQESALETATFWDKFKAAALSGGNVLVALQKETQYGLERQREKIAEVQKENDKWRGSLVRVYQQTDQVLGQLDQYNVIMDRQVKTDERAAQVKDDLKRKQQELDAAYKKGLTSIITFKEQIDKLNETFKAYEETIKDLEKVNISAKIVEDLNKIKEARIEAAKQLSSGLQEVATSIKTLTDVPTDQFLMTFTEFRNQLEKAFTFPEQGVKKYSDILKKFLNENTRLTQDQKKVLTDLTEGYRAFDTLIRTTPGFEKIINNLKETNTAWNKSILDIEEGTGSWNGFLNILGDISAATGEFKLEIDEATGLIQEIGFDPILARENANKVYNEIRQGLIRPITEDLLVQRQEFLKQQLTLTTLTDVEKKTLEGQLKNVENNIKKFKETGKLDAGVIDEKEITNAVNSVIGQFNKLLSAVVGAEQKVFIVGQQVETLTKDLSKSPDQLSKAIAGTLLANIDAVSNVLIGIRTKEQKIEKDFIDKIKKDRDGLEKFKQDLIKQGVNVEKASYDDLLAAYIAYKKKEKEVDDKANEDKKKSRKETTDNILRGIQEFSNVLNQISSLSAERIRTDVESLQIAQKKALEKVVGDSESAAQKRIEIQTEYEAKIKEIEKKGRIQSLQFSLVQTIANGAQAVIKALAELGPIAGPILAGVNAALTLGQIAIINDQIQNAQMMRRGGFLRAQGGMLLSGPSHEGGGIPLAQYGVVAEGQEAIINRQSSINFRDLLSTINQSGGGRPLVVNNFDDSRIVEAIASQKQKPLRAYVLGSDITNEQAISKRLDDLSKI